jgi:hypothetical protein
MKIIFRRGKAALLLHRARKDALSGSMWDENYMHLSEILVARGNTAQKSLFSEINKLKDKPLHKIYVIELFYYRQKLDGKLKFAEWYRMV